MKVYTIIDTFSLGTPDRNQCFIANYKRREDAVCALREKLAEYDLLDDEGNIITGLNQIDSVENLFGKLLSGGYGYAVENSDYDLIFVRAEELREDFSPEQVRFDS